VLGKQCLTGGGSRKGSDRYRNFLSKFNQHYMSSKRRSLMMPAFSQSFQLQTCMQLQSLRLNEAGCVGSDHLQAFSRRVPMKRFQLSVYWPTEE